MSQTTRDLEIAHPIDEYESLSMAVIEAVAEAEDVDPIDLRPLYDSIDPDALDSLFRFRLDGGVAADAHLAFVYHGYEVSIHDDRLLLRNART